MYNDNPLHINIIVNIRSKKHNNYDYKLNNNGRQTTLCYKSSLLPHNKASPQTHTHKQTPTCDKINVAAILNSLIFWDNR